jgi:anti-sigma factor RsiW
VRHRRANRLLADLLDGALPPQTQLAVRAHARDCPACRKRLREHRAVEALVRLLPPALVPVEPSIAAQVRLWGLARWFADPVAQARERMGLSAVGVGVAVLLAVLTVTIGSWPPFLDPDAVIVLAQITPDAALLPLGWR